MRGARPAAGESLPAGARSGAGSSRACGSRIGAGSGALGLPAVSRGTRAGAPRALAPRRSVPAQQQLLVQTALDAGVARAEHASRGPATGLAALVSQAQANASAPTRSASTRMAIAPRFNMDRPSRRRRRESALVEPRVRLPAPDRATPKGGERARGYAHRRRVDDRSDRQSA